MLDINIIFDHFFEHCTSDFTENLRQDEAITLVFR